MRVEAARFCLRSFQICKGFRFRSWYVGFQGLLAKLSKDLLTGLGAAVKCFGNHLGFARSLDACALGSCVLGSRSGIWHQGSGFDCNVGGTEKQQSVLVWGHGNRCRAYTQWLSK